MTKEFQEDITDFFGLLKRSMETALSSGLIPDILVIEGRFERFLRALGMEPINEAVLLGGKTGLFWGQFHGLSLVTRTNA